MPEQLSPHFSFEELTITQRLLFQQLNRYEANGSAMVMDSLRALAWLLEAIRGRTGPLEVHSGYRCKTINDVVGSSGRSQHLLGQAADISKPGPDSRESLNELFGEVLHLLKSRSLMFGQLIREEGDRGYGRAYWLHISLGHPYRPIGRCGQVLDAAPGYDGKMVYTMLQKLNLAAKEVA